VRGVRAGDTVGYGAAWTAPRPSRIAVLSVGYADGYLRQAGSTDRKTGAPVRVNGVICPLAGRVSMDLIAVDVTDAGAVEAGGMATLIGDGIGLDDVAEAAGTIGYEILTSLGRRYHRLYVD
jgi:alanine racemase